MLRRLISKKEKLFFVKDRSSEIFNPEEKFNVESNGILTVS